MRRSRVIRMAAWTLLAGVAHAAETTASATPTAPAPTTSAADAHLRDTHPADDAIVITVGESTLRASELRRRWRQIPKFQRDNFGPSIAEQYGHFIQQLVIPDLLLSEGAKAKATETSARLKNQWDYTLVETLDHAQTEALQGQIGPEQVKKYYEAHRSHFQRPAQIQIWRILTGIVERAKSILKQVRGTGGPQRWSALAREHSLDKATYMRKGNLGFIDPTGQSHMPQVRVNPALYGAASQVQDGEIVATPVAVGNRFAVVWRRGSLPEQIRSLEDATAEIRQVLVAQRVNDERATLLTRLRKQQLSQVDLTLLKEVSKYSALPAAAGNGRLAPSAKADPTRSGVHAPEPGSQGLR